MDAAPLLAMQNEYDMQMAERNESIAYNISLIIISWKTYSLKLYSLATKNHHFLVKDSDFV